MRLVLSLLATLLLSGPATAQDYPSRPIRVLEPLAAGSAVDVVTRIVADRMGRILGGSLFVDNQPGAAGLLGMRAGAHAAADGYTILAVNDSVVTVLPNIRGDAGYDPRTAFAPIVQLVRIHWALVASPSLHATTLAQFIAAAKANPGVIDYASGGQGSPQHIAMELLMRAAGIRLQHVPFRGTTPALNEVVAGHIPVMFTALPTPLPFLADGRLRILGVADPHRLPGAGRAPLHRPGRLRRRRRAAPGRASRVCPAARRRGRTPAGRGAGAPPADPRAGRHPRRPGAGSRARPAWRPARDRPVAGLGAASRAGRFPCSG